MSTNKTKKYTFTDRYSIIYASSIVNNLNLEININHSDAKPQSITILLIPLYPNIYFNFNYYLSTVFNYYYYL